MYIFSAWWARLHTACRTVSNSVITSDPTLCGIRLCLFGACGSAIINALPANLCNKSVFMLLVPLWYLIRRRHLPFDRNWVNLMNIAALVYGVLTLVYFLLPGVVDVLNYFASVTFNGFHKILAGRCDVNHRAYHTSGGKASGACNLTSKVFRECRN